MEQKQNQLSVDKLIRTFRSNIKSEKSCSPSPPLLLLQTGVEESVPSKLESIDESSSSSTNSTTTTSNDKPVCLIQANDLSEMNSVLSLLKINFPNVNVHLCLNTLNETHTTKSDNLIQNNANRTKFLSPSLKHSERASSIDNSSLNSIERQESKDSGFWSVSKCSFESTKSLSISDSHSASHQISSSPHSTNQHIQQQQSKAEDNKSMNENYLTSPGNKSPYWKKWKKGQAWRYNSSSSNLSTDCSQNCEEGTTRNTSLNYNSFESTGMSQNDAENSKSNLSLTHVGTHFSNSFESSQTTQSSLSIQNSHHHHLWASTSKLDQLHAQNSLEYTPNILSSLTIDESNNLSKGQKRRGKLVRDRTIDNTDEQQSLNSFNNLTITSNNLTNNSVKLENTRFDSISSLISPLSISSKDSNQATSPTGNSYKPNPFLNSNGRVSPPEKRLSLNNDSIKLIKSTPPSVSSSPAPPSIHDAFVNAVLAAAISKSGSSQNSPINENQYDFYKDLNKLNIKNNDDYNVQTKSSPSPPVKQTSNFLSTTKLVSRSNSSPSYSSSCSNIPSLQNSIPVQMNLPFASPSVSSIYNAFNMNENNTQQYTNSKSLSTCSLPMAAAAAAAAHFMNNQVVSNQLKLSSNESLNFNRMNTRPPAIVITESKIDNDLSEYNQNERPNLVKQEGIYSSNNVFAPLQQLKSMNEKDNNLWKTMNNNTNQFLNPNRNPNNNENNNNNKQAKPHVCPSCQKRFARSDMLIRHSRLHSGVRPYRCNRCGQEFSRSDHLNTHLRTHTGEKPYSCPHPKCTYAACRKDMITRHLKVHNKNRIAISFDNSTSNADNNMTTLNQFQLQQGSGSNGKIDLNQNKSLMHNFPSISFDSANLNFMNHRHQQQQQHISSDQQQMTSIKMEESKDIKNFEIFNQLKS